MPKKNDERRENITKLGKAITLYEKELKKGKRAAEILTANPKQNPHPFLKQIDAVLQDAPVGGMAGLTALAMGGTVRYKTTDAEKKRLKKIRERFVQLIDAAREAPICPHEKVTVLSYFPGGFTPPSIDVQCNECDSVLLIHDPSKILSMVGFEICKGETWYEKLTEVCKERGIPRDHDSPPLLINTV